MDCLVEAEDIQLEIICNAQDTKNHPASQEYVKIPPYRPSKVADQEIGGSIQGEEE